MERALAGLGSRFSQKLSARWSAVGYGNNLEISGGTVSNETPFSASFPKLSICILVVLQVLGSYVVVVRVSAALAT